jgi:hypothetical protein
LGGRFSTLRSSPNGRWSDPKIGSRSGAFEQEVTSATSLETEICKNIDCLCGSRLRYGIDAHDSPFSMAGFARRGHDPIFIPLGRQKDRSVIGTFIGRIRTRNNSAVSAQENVELKGFSCLQK